MVCDTCCTSFCASSCRRRAEQLGIHSPLECRAVATLSRGFRPAGASARDRAAGALLLVRLACRAAGEVTSHAGSREPRWRHVDALAPLPGPLSTLIPEGESTSSAAFHVFRHWERTHQGDADNVELAAAAASVLCEVGWTIPEGWRSELALQQGDSREALEQALLLVHRKVLCNCFGLSAAAPDGAEAGPEEGWGVYPAASLFNHSCVPTLFWEFGGKASDRGRLTFRALRPLPAGAPLTITYGRSAGRQSRAARLATMREHWRFQCRCGRCEAEARGADAKTLAALAAFDEEFRCRRCFRLGPSRTAITDNGSRPRGCSCLRARNRLAG